jgi:hypothetical protein
LSNSKLLVAATAPTLLAVLARAASLGGCRSGLTAVAASQSKADLAAFRAVFGAAFFAAAKGLTGLAAILALVRAAVLAIGAAPVRAARRRRRGSRLVAGGTWRVFYG